MSLSSNIISNVTAFRNINGSEHEWTKMRHRAAPYAFHVLTAQMFYITTIPVAIIETALAAVAKILTRCLPIGDKNHAKMTNWLKSASFAILWSSTDATINLLSNDLVQTEKVARAIASTSNPWVVPQWALKK